MSQLISIYKDDIPYESAFRAHAGTSFSPEDRARCEQESYVQDVGAFVDEIAQYATDENRAEMIASLEAYKTGHLKRKLALLAAESRIVSTMIAGPANFPVRQMEKRNQTARKRLEEFLEWDKKVRERLRRQYNPSEKLHQAIFSDDDDACGQLRAKIAELEAHQERMKAVNKILRSPKLTVEHKIAQCAELGVMENVVRSLLAPDRGYDIGFQTFELSNNSANIRRYKQRLEGLERQQQDTTQTFEIGRVRVVDNVEDFRVQLFFPERTSVDLYHELRHAGFVYSRTNQAFQRKRSATALALAKELAAKF